MLVISLALAIILSLGVPWQCQGAPSQEINIEPSMPERPPAVKITRLPEGKYLIEPLSPPPKDSPSPPSPSPPLPSPPPPSPSKPVRSGEFSSPAPLSHLVLSKVRMARYVWGTSLETGSATDCSGFVRWVYRLCKIDLPRTSAEQSHVGQEVARDIDLTKLEEGDLLFFSQGERAVGHVGIYLGDGKMVHATRNAGGVEVTDVERDYYQAHFVVAKRVFEKTWKRAVYPVAGGIAPLPSPAAAVAKVLPVLLPGSLVNIVMTWRVFSSAAPS